MSVSTNSLVEKLKRYAIPLGSVAGVLLTAAFLFNHNVAHAAVGAAAPIDDSSVSSLVVT